MEELIKSLGLNGALICAIVALTVPVVALVKKNYLASKSKLAPAVAMVVALMLTAAWLLWQWPAGMNLTSWLGHWFIHGLASGVFACGAYSAAVSPIAKALGLK